MICARECECHLFFIGCEPTPPTIVFVRVERNGREGQSTTNQFFFVFQFNIFSMKVNYLLLDNVMDTLLISNKKNKTHKILYFTFCRLPPNWVQIQKKEERNRIIIMMKIITIIMTIRFSIMKLCVCVRISFDHFVSLSIIFLVFVFLSQYIYCPMLSISRPRPDVLSPHFKHTLTRTYVIVSFRMLTSCVFVIICRSLDLTRNSADFIGIKTSFGWLDFIDSSHWFILFQKFPVSRAAALTHSYFVDDCTVN